MKRILFILSATCLSGAVALADGAKAQIADLKVEEWTVPELGIKLVRIPAGSFTRGSPKNEADRRDDEAQHEVTIGRPFYMGVHEVLQKEYYDIMLPNFDHDSWMYLRGPLHVGAAFHYRERAVNSWTSWMGAKEMKLQYPMECVTWHKAREFCRKVTERERKAGRLPKGYVYRLPTEAEWEYACRAGNKGPYNVKPEGDENLKSGEYLKRFAVIDGGKTQKAGQCTPNAWGLYDMHGNVYEWCLDWYGDYPTGKVKDPTGPTEGRKKAARGGSFTGPPPHSPPGNAPQGDAARDAGPFMRSASRDKFDPDANFYAILGFRVVLAPEVKSEKK